MNKKTQYGRSLYSIWGFILAWFGVSLLSMNIVGLIFSVLGLMECRRGEKRGEGWAVAGLVLGVIFLINTLVSWESYADIKGVLGMNVTGLVLLLIGCGLYRFYRRGKMWTDSALPGHAGGTGPAKQAVKQKTAQPAAKSGSIPPVKPGEVSKSAAEYVHPGAKSRPEDIKEKLLAEEARRIAEEEEAERQRRRDTEARKGFRREILAAAAAEPPSEEEILTPEGQRRLYGYALRMFPAVHESDAGRFLMTENIDDAETMIETVSGVMEDLSRAILDSGSEMPEHWKTLGKRELLQGIRAFTFYQQMSVGSEPFEMITDELIDEMYAESGQSIPHEAGGPLHEY